MSRNPYFCSYKTSNGSHNIGVCDLRDKPLKSSASERGDLAVFKMSRMIKIGALTVILEQFEICDFVHPFPYILYKGGLEQKSIDFWSKIVHFGIQNLLTLI